MAKNKIEKSDGHYLAGTEVTVDTEINFVNTSNPEIDTTGGSFIWKLITAVASAWKLRDDTKGQDIITIDSSTDTVTANATDYTFVGFGAASAATAIVFTIESTSYNAVAFDWVDMTTAGTGKTVTFPASPVADDIIKVSKADSGVGVITVDGNGKNINGAANDTINSQYTIVSYQYNGTEWRKF